MSGISAIKDKDVDEDLSKIDEGLEPIDAMTQVAKRKISEYKLEHKHMHRR